MKKVYAEFEVADDADLSDVALALEIRFKAEGNTATVWRSADELFADVVLDQSRG